MPTKVVMPQLGETVAEGTVARWLKREGERIEKDEPLVEVVTDKVNAEIPSPESGFLQEIRVKEGETVAVGEEIATISEIAGLEQAVAEAEAALGARAAGERKAAAQEEASTEEGKRASPAVRRLAQEHGIDLAKVLGSGLGGRVTREDVMNFLKTGAKEPAPASAAQAQPGATPSPISTPSRRDEEAIQLTPMRRSIAEHMVRSMQTAPQSTMVMEADLTSLVRWREKIKEEFYRREGVNLTYLPFLIKATVAALREYPVLNATWAGDRIIVKRQINIGVAVGLENGLIVPVIHAADTKSIVALARELDDLITRARAGTLTLRDVQGSTFTVNNTGAFGSLFSTPIINQGQAGILSMETIVKRPVVLDNEAIAVRSMAYLCLTIDHRLVDGLQASRFLRSVKNRLEAFDSSTSLY